MSPTEYFSDYDDDKEPLDKETLSKIWTEHVRIFEILLDTCPFDICSESVRWLKNALEDI